MKTERIFIYFLLGLGLYVPAYSDQQDADFVHPPQKEYKHEAFLKWLHDRPFHTIGMDPPKSLPTNSSDQEEKDIARKIERDLLKQIHVIGLNNHNQNENCRYFYTSNIENDNFIMSFIHSPGNDTGYTHGHFRSLTKSCTSGQDITLSWDSRAFTDYEYSRIQLEDNSEIRYNNTVIYNPFLKEYAKRVLAAEPPPPPLPSTLTVYRKRVFDAKPLPPPPPSALKEYLERVRAAYPPFPPPPSALREYEERLQELAPPRPLEGYYGRSGWEPEEQKSSEEYQEYRKQLEEYRSSEEYQEYKRLSEEYDRRFEEYLSSEEYKKQFEEFEASEAYQEYERLAEEYDRRFEEYLSSEEYEKQLEELKASEAYQEYERLAEEYDRRVAEYKSSEEYKKQLEELKASEAYQEYERLAEEFKELYTRYEVLVKEAEKEDKEIRVYKFEEQNQFSLTFTNWRKFKQIYQTIGLIIGHVSRNHFYGAVREQELFHEILSGDIEGIPKYEYIDESEEKIYVGGIVALGKSFSLSGNRDICGEVCRDYFRAEVGTELNTLSHGSNVYVSSEMDKTLPSPFNMISLSAAAKTSYNSTVHQVFSTGLRVYLRPFQFHLSFKYRELLDGKDRAIQYDKDADTLIVLGFSIEGDLVKNPKTLGFKIE